MQYTDKQIADLIDGIHSGKYTTTELPESLYYAIANYLKKGLDVGFGVGDKDEELLKELQDNIYMFSAAKTYNEVRDMSELLTDGDSVRPFNEFKSEAMKIYGQYNEDWLKAEYNTAVASGTMAKQWSVIESTKDVLPNLRYSTTEVACPICTELDGTVAPVDDDFWNTFYPPNHYNCFPNGTKVLTPNGWKNIESLRVNDSIIGGSSNVCNIDTVHTNAFNGELVNITIKNNSVSSTKNHSILTIDGWKKAENIRIADIVINHSYVTGFNKVINCINNMTAIRRYLFISVKRKWEAARMNALNTHIQFWDKYIYKSTINQFVCSNSKPIRLEKIKNNALNFIWRFMIHTKSFWVILIGLYRFIVCLIPYRFIKHRVINSHSIRSIRSFFTKHRVWVVLPVFRKYRTLLFSSIFSFNPLKPYAFASGFGFNAKFIKYSNEGSGINTPFITNTFFGNTPIDIHGSEGFTNGAPLNSFNSKIGFWLYSFFHMTYNNVISIANVQYNGNINNFTVNKDNSYITEIGIVHNCMCIVLQEDSDVEVTQDKPDTSDEMDDVFKINVGKERVIFSDEHPYFTSAPKSLGENNFGLPIPDTDE